MHLLGCMAGRAACKLASTAPPARSLLGSRSFIAGGQRACHASCSLHHHLGRQLPALVDPLPARHGAEQAQHLSLPGGGFVHRIQARRPAVAQILRGQPPGDALRQPVPSELLAPQLFRTTLALLSRTSSDARSQLACIVAKTRSKAAALLLGPQPTPPPLPASAAGCSCTQALTWLSHLFP